jgi:hypothetical protein
MDGNFRAGIALSISLVLSTIIGSSVFLKAKKLTQAVQVTGSAKTRIKSDLIVWNASVTVEGAVLSDAYHRLDKNVESARAFLVSKGISADQIQTSAVQATPIRKGKQPNSDQDSQVGQITGYQLKQSLEIRSADVDKVSAVSRQVTELINQGIFLESDAPQYLYTKLADTKIAILGAAAQDALARAKQIAAATGSSVGEIRSADMGVLQITPADSSDVSEEGVNDTTSLEKDITAVVHMTFALD